MDIRALHDAFGEDLRNAEKTYGGKSITVEAYALSAGTSEYGTPVVMASDRPGGDRLAVFVLPYDHRIDESFARLSSVAPGQRLQVTGTYRLFDEGDEVIVFKNSELFDIDEPGEPTRS